MCDLGIVHLMLPFLQQLMADFGVSTRNNRLLQICLFAQSKARNARRSCSAYHAFFKTASIPFGVDNL